MGRTQTENQIRTILYKWDWQWCQCQCTGSEEPGSETTLETKHQEDSEEESSSAESVADDSKIEEGSDAISREAPVEDHWAQVTSRRFPSPTLDCKSKYWRALLQKLALCEHCVMRLGISHRVIAPADSALADIEQNMWVLNSIVKAILYWIYI